MTGLKAAFIRWRNAKISDLAFQRWAARNPFTRPVSRRKIRQQFALNTGFVQTQIMTLCVELKLLDLTQAQPEQIAQPAALQPLLDGGQLTVTQVERLMRAAVAIDLLERVGDGYMLSQLGASLQGSQAVQAMVLHHRAFYEDMRDPLKVLKMADGSSEETSELKRYWGYAQNDDGAQALHDSDTAPYSQLMVSTQDFIAHEVLRAYNFGRHSGVMDVGGNEGRFLAAVAAANPTVKCHLFDLPSVVARAERKIAAGDIGSGDLPNRFAGIGGSFFTDPLPHHSDTGCDCITFVRVVHDHDDRVIEPLLAKAYSALPPGGRIVIAEPLAEVKNAEEMGDAYFGFYLAAMGSGRPRSADTLTRMLTAAGFDSIAQHRTDSPLLVSVLSATRA